MVRSRSAVLRSGATGGRRRPVWLAAWVVAVALVIGSGARVVAVPIGDLGAVKLLGLISTGTDGSAWIEYGQQKFLVTPGYQLTAGVRVTAVRRDAVVIYDSRSRQYHLLSIPGTDHLGKQRAHEVTIRTGTLPLPMHLRMVARAFDRDYICHSLTAAVATALFHSRGEKYLLDRLMPAHHAWRLRGNTIFAGPQVVLGVRWTNLLGRLDEFRSERLAQWFPPLAGKGSIISDGKDLYSVVKQIEAQTKVGMRWESPHSLPLYCSFKDRPWHEILEIILIYNGLGIYPTEHGLMIAPPR